jgi:hypothetical protein
MWIVPLDPAPTRGACGARAGQLILATRKDRAHRIYLGDGVYADLHLRYQGGCFRPLDWTYPDYRAPAVLTFFSQARALFYSSYGWITPEQSINQTIRKDE